MAWGKSEEEKEVERRRKEAEKAAAASEKEARRQAAAAEQERQEFLASPLGQAIAAKEAGLRFFETELAVGAIAPSGWLNTKVRSKAYGGRTDALGAIEQVGWRLENIGYVHVPTQSNTMSGVGRVQTFTEHGGVTRGIYLFRNTSPDA